MFSLIITIKTWYFQFPVVSFSENWYREGQSNKILEQIVKMDLLQ